MKAYRTDTSAAQLKHTGICVCYTQREDKQEFAQNVIILREINLCSKFLKLMEYYLFVFQPNECYFYIVLNRTLLKYGEV